MPARPLALALGFLSTMALPVVTAEPQPSSPADPFADWPAEAHPAIVGGRLVDNFLPRPYRCQVRKDRAHLGIIYPEVVTWYGALTFARAAKDAQRTQQLIEKFEPFFCEPQSGWINRMAHVDYRVFGALPLEIHLQKPDPRCLRLGLELADAQWQDPDESGITREARYWIDDMYMIPLVQVQALRATGRKEYADRAALAMDVYLERLQEPNGLFHHGTDSPFFWGRGNGWIAAGLAELLISLDPAHPRHPPILAGYHKMMATLLATQDESGLWRQLVDQEDSWLETSGSAMFAYAMVTGVRQGWLDRATYGPAARKAWLALVAHLDEDANLREVCIGTDKGFDKPYYLERPRAAGDLHGQAPMLWTATALLRPDRKD